MHVYCTLFFDTLQFADFQAVSKKVVIFMIFAAVSCSFTGDYDLSKIKGIFFVSYKKSPYLCSVERDEERKKV